MLSTIDFQSNKFIEYKRNISVLLLWVYTLNAVLIPYDTFGLKKISFLLVIFINLDVFYKRLEPGDVAILLMGILLPVYTIVKSIILTGQVLDNVLSGYTGTIILLFFIARKYNINYCKIFIVSTIVLALLVDTSVILDTLKVITVRKNPILRWMSLTDNATISKNQIYVFNYRVFIKTTPMLLLSIGLLLEKKKYLWSIVVLFALFFSGTRGNMLLSSVVFVICVIISEKDKKRRAIYTVAVLLVVLYFLFAKGFLNRYLSYSAVKEAGDNVRTLSLKSIINIWKDRPLSFFIGQGYSAEFYNLGRRQWVSDNELSYWNLLRRVGITCFLLMMYCYARPFICSIKKRFFSPTLVGYVAYFIGAYVNPLLYTSTGLTVLLCVYIYLFLDNRQLFDTTTEKSTLIQHNNGNVKKLDISDIHSITLDLMDMVHNICETNGLTYYIAYGSLIGAIRHNGFIPWDDDFDIWMMRDDYEKFIDIVRNHNNPRYRIATRADDENYPYGIARFYDANYQFFHTTLKNQFNLGVFIDIYPLDSCSSSYSDIKHILNKIQRINYCYSIYQYKFSLSNKIRTVIKLPIHYLLRMVYGKTYNKRVDERILRIIYSENDKLAENVCVYWEPSEFCYYNRSLFSEKQLHQFEDRYYWIPKEYDTILSLQYGDYMTMPPVDKRCPTHDYEIFICEEKK